MAARSELAPPPPLADLEASRRIAIFLDFDGTLVDIAPSPSGIELPEELRERLETLSGRIGGRLAIISGRSAADLRRHLGPARIALAGSHGAEPFREDGSAIGSKPRPLPSAFVSAIEDFATQHETIRAEIKTYGAALHYRSDPDKEDEVQAFLSALARNGGFKVKRGKMVRELVRKEASKCGAVRVFLEEDPFASAMPIFIGDDVTDEDGFLEVERQGGFGILVGAPRETSARYRLPAPKDVHAWLGL